MLAYLTALNVVIRSKFVRPFLVSTIEISMIQSQGCRPRTYKTAAIRLSLTSTVLIHIIRNSYFYIQARDLPPIGNNTSILCKM
jgi:ABC-type Mn2+/Zn2+ transport system permease subunit